VELQSTNEELQTMNDDAVRRPFLNLDIGLPIEIGEAAGPRAARRR
jgi:hypothetical protein